MNIGDRVTIPRKLLNEDQSIYPHGTIIEIIDKNTVLVEIDFIEEKIKLEQKYLILKEKSKRKD